MSYIITMIVVPLLLGVALGRIAFHFRVRAWERRRREIDAVFDAIDAKAKLLAKQRYGDIMKGDT